MWACAVAAARARLLAAGFGRDPRVREEDLVERGVAVHLAQGTHLHARLLHREREARDAFVLRRVPVGSSEEQAEFRVVRARVPDLLAIDDPLVAVARCPRGQAGEMGAAAGLPEQAA